jgi:hypothetical protein
MDLLDLSKKHLQEVISCQVLFDGLSRFKLAIRLDFLLILAQSVYSQYYEWS